MSVPEICQLWGITRSTYNNWVETYPEFKEADEHGKRDCMSWWHKLNRDVASGKVRGNAGVICFAMKNVEGIGWQDKVAIDNSGPEPIRQINISILPPPNKALEHNPTIIEYKEDE